MKYLGLDPGAHGGIAWIDGPTVGAAAFPGNPEAAVRLIAEHAPGAVAVLERVGAAPGMGGASAFSFGKSTGYLLGALIALGVPVVEVVPMRWQRVLGCLTPPTPRVLSAAERRAVKRDHKLQLQALAQAWFPHLQVTAATADALLLAVYCQRQAWSAHPSQKERSA